ncbi:MAG: hypothetical protein JST26_02310 [Bacteroidetes bacterium]|nr:hypothetical protein [Bacteroidota bacterium]
MNTPKSYNTQQKNENLIGNPAHKHFLVLQAEYGIAQRGGVKIPALSEAHARRLVSQVNILDQVENRKLIFSEIIISN